jgi:predicted ribosomally synthesized peptide with SipW-like signal peptide
MTNSKNTRRALISSAFAILMCVAMLIGTTFAWFTDTAKTSVNKIQSGKLDVQLVDAEGNDLEGKTLEWVKAEGTDAVLWEPGCTYELPAVYVKNNGNLALKYKLAVTGLDGDAELLKAITFTVDGADLDTEKALAVDATSDPIIIKGHMDENAGNEYQEKSLDGIAITVVATQYTAEFDSYGNEYDKYAAYYTVNTAEELTASLTSANDGDIIALANSIEVASNDYNVSKRLEIAADNVTVDLNGKEL